MDDSKKEFVGGRSCAFVPPWQLDGVAGVGPTPNGQQKRSTRLPPPLPPRNNAINNNNNNNNNNDNSHDASRSFRSPFSSRALPPLLSSYSSPFLGSAFAPPPPPSIARFASGGGVNWDPLHPSSAAPRTFNGSSSSSSSLDPLTSGHPWLRSASPAFEGIESLVMTARSICVMVESSYQALHSSLCVILGVADHFSKLKAHLVSVVSSLSLLKLFKWILDQFLTFLRFKKRRQNAEERRSLAPDGWAEDFSASVSTALSDPTPAKTTPLYDAASSTPSYWPLVAFFGIAVGAPWLLWKTITSSSSSSSSSSTASSSLPSPSLTSPFPPPPPTSTSSSSSPSWSLGIGEHFVAKAEFEFDASSDDELSFRKDDLLKVAPKHLQMLSPKGWYLASKDGTAVGYVPANRVQVLVKLEGKCQ